MPEALDNPAWESLISLHTCFALRAGAAARFQPAIAPFAAMQQPDAEATESLEQLTAAGESLLLLGPAPILPAHWQSDESVLIAQMVCHSPVNVPDGPAVIELTALHVDDLLALTRRVYPHYFRPLTHQLGRYFGIYDDNTLAAIVGERLGFAGHREISTICTHPDYTGRGYAQRLLAWLSNDILTRDRLPFLHVGHQNTRAKSLYEFMGYRRRTDIALQQVTRLR